MRHAGALLYSANVLLSAALTKLEGTPLEDALVEQIDRLLKLKLAVFEVEVFDAARVEA